MVFVCQSALDGANSTTRTRKKCSGMVAEGEIKSQVFRPLTRVRLSRGLQTFSPHFIPWGGYKFSEGLGGGAGIKKVCLTSYESAVLVAQ